MEAVKAIVPKMKAGADYILVAAHSGIGDNEYTKNEEMKVTKLLVSKVLMLLRQAFSCGFPKWRWHKFLCEIPCVDDVNGLINETCGYGW